MADASLEATGLHKVYADGATRVHAVRGVSLAVHPGALVLIMGPSGSGKTTLLSMMGCILRPTEGALRVMGEEVTWAERALPLLRRRYIGFVFQHFNLFQALTACENVEVAYNLRGVNGGEARSRARRLLEMIGLAERWRFLPEDLSGGEKQRVSIARALAGDPPIVLADEPTGNLDSENGRLIIEVLRDLARREKRAVVIVSHDARIVDLADEVYLMEDGRVRRGP